MACALHRKGWLNQSGTLNDSIKMRYDDIPGVSENINRCLISDLSFELVEQLRCIREAFKTQTWCCLEMMYTRNQGPRN